MRSLHSQVALPLARGATAVCALALICASKPQQAEHRPLVDARTAIGRMTANDPEAKIERAEEAFDRHLRTFAAVEPTMAPADAAAAWLSLVDEAVAIPHRSLNGAMGGAMPMPIGTLRTVLLELPRPDTWPSIKELVEKRPLSVDRSALRILCARLLGDDEAVLGLCDEFDRQYGKVANDVSPGKPTDAIRLRALRRQDRLATPAGIKLCLADESRLTNSLPYLGDLIPLADAKRLILERVKQPDVSMSFLNPRNAKLAQAVVLSHLNEIATPQWSLAEHWDDADYVRRLVARYGYSSLIGPNSSAGSAVQIYFRWLVVDGKIEEAAKLAKDASGSFRISAEDWGPEEGVDKTIEALQARLPKVDLWDVYAGAAVACHHIPDAIARLQKAEAATKSGEQKSRLHASVIELHARTGDLKALSDDVDTWDRSQHGSAEFDPCQSILGRALAAGDNRLTSKLVARELKSDVVTTYGDLSRALAHFGRFALLEKLALNDVSRFVRENKSYGWPPTELCEIYYNAGRPADVLTLFKEFPWWPVNDASKLSDSPYSYSFGSEERPVSFYAAWAFEKTGQRDLAVRVLRQSLQSGTKCPDVFELLNRIDGAPALGIYDELVQMRPLDETALLWKGDLQFRLGRNAEAEASIRAALKINPVGTFASRAKLNDLLGKILIKKGDRAGADSCMRLAAAVRLASHASDLFQMRSGLIDLAATVLGRAVAMFPTDSALQAQLGHYLFEQCRFGESKQHYALACKYSLSAMGERADLPIEETDLLELGDLPSQCMATLDSVVKRHATDARAYAARASLEADLGLSKEAVADCKKAVEIDPNDVAAWQRLSSLCQIGLLSASDLQDVEFRMIDLTGVQDPVYREIDLTCLKDLRQAYQKLSAKLVRLPIKDENLFALHSATPPRREINWPRFDPLSSSGRLVGAYFQSSEDIDFIAVLHHPTRYPFD